MISFTIPGQPVPKGRPKFARRGSFVQAYTPEKTASYENLVKLHAAQAMAGGAPITGAVELRIWLQVAIPSSMTKRDRAKIGTGGTLPVKKPDLDNVLKALTDAMNGIVYKDDAQIVRAVVDKVYSETPKAEVLVQRCEEMVY